MYVARQLAGAFARARTAFPSVLITGPRQSGKTTFLRHEAADAAYATFDDPLTRAFARDDPNGFLDGFGEGPVVLDEIQYAPGILPYVKMRVDRERRPGRFLLTGSQQFELMRGVTESLAGRVAILELLPMSIAEAGERPLRDVVWNGGFPDPALHAEARDLWVSSYLRTYVERDVRQVKDIQDLAAFERFLALVAARHGQEHHAAPLARDCGVSQPTIASWTSVLAASYVVHLLEPWHRNLGKRLVKAPKLYFLDSALVCALTRQPSGDAALASLLGGPLLEGVVVTEAIKAFAARGQRPACWSWRSGDGLEVDLVLEIGGRIVPIEAKLTATPSTGHATPLRRFRELVGADADAGVLVCGVAEETRLPGGVVALPWTSWSTWLAARLALS